MGAFQVTCHTPDEMNAERRIRGLGGQGWWFPTDAIIRMIETRQHEFWVSIDQQRVELVAMKHGATGRAFLTTSDGGFPPKALLNLPACDLTNQGVESRDKSRWSPVA